MPFSNLRKKLEGKVSKSEPGVSQPSFPSRDLRPAPVISGLALRLSSDWRGVAEVVGTYQEYSVAQQRMI